MSSQFKLLSPHDESNVVESIVGMSVYINDRLDWVKQSIDSILQQTYSDYVFAIVIDGPVDIDVLTFLLETAKKHPHIALFEGRENKGLSVCMNQLIEWSLDLGVKYFFRMDADDIAEPTRMQKQVAYMDLHEDISILGTCLLEVNEIGRQVGKRNLPQHHDEIVKYLPKRCAINHPTVVIRVNVFESGARYREDLINTQDYFMWTNLAKAGFKFANLDDRLLKFRRVNDFYKRRGLSKSINEFKARFYAMQHLNSYSLGGVIYAFAVLGLRVMPERVIKVAYKLDRYLLNKKVEND